MNQESCCDTQQCLKLSDRSQVIESKQSDRWINLGSDSQKFFLCWSELIRVNIRLVFDIVSIKTDQRSLSIDLTCNISIKYFIEILSARLCHCEEIKTKLKGICKLDVGLYLSSRNGKQHSKDKNDDSTLSQI